MATRREQQWQGSRYGAMALRFLASILPLALSLFFAFWLSRVIPSPESLPLIVVWWLGIMAASTVVLRITDRHAKRLLPLAVLMKLSLVFPDQAPSRFRVALKSGDTTNLQALLKEAVEARRSNDLSRVAETILALAAALNTHDPHTADDTNGSSCVELAAATVSANSWDTVDAHVERVYDFGPVTYSVPNGRVLRLMLAVDKARGGRMYFGFDTLEYPAVATFDLR